MTDSEVIVETDSVGYRRGSAEILDDINFAVRKGEHWVLLGPNGAGKTTLAKLLAGRTYPTTGTVVALGEDTTESEADYLAARIGVASLSDRERIPAGDDVLSVVLAASWGQTGQFDEEYEAGDASRAEDLLAALGIGHLGDRTFSTLSEGEKQRVSIARALMPDPELIILDEPTAGLDLGARETLLAALSEIMAHPETPAVLLITHELEEIAPTFTHAALMAEGKVEAAGPLSEVVTSQSISDLFGVPLTVTKQDDRYWAHKPGN